MKNFTVVPCDMPKMDDDETPYVPLWRVLVNGKPHREVLEAQDQPVIKETATRMEAPKSIQ